MGSDKIVDFDPRKRLTKEALKNIQGTVASFQPGDIENLMVLYTKKDGEVVFEAFGIDWPLLGISQAYIESLRAALLFEDIESTEGSE